MAAHVYDVWKCENEPHPKNTISFLSILFSGKKTIFVFSEFVHTLSSLVFGNYVKERTKAFGWVVS